MKKLNLIIIFFTICLLTFTEEKPSYFVPEVLETKDEKLSNIIIELYKEKIFNNENSVITEWNEKSDEKGIFINHFVHSEINWLKWSNLNVQTDEGGFYFSDIKFKNDIEKRLIFYARWHSWRGVIYTGYILEKDETSNLEFLNINGDENKNKIFYPDSRLAYGSYFAWWINNVFEYKEDFYYINEADSYNRHNGYREIIKITSSGDLEIVVRLKIGLSMKEILEIDDLNAFRAYFLVVDSIFGGDTNCGTSNAQGYARRDALKYTTSSIIMPWKIDKKEIKEFEATKLFLAKWGNEEIWNKREYDTFLNHVESAKYELSLFYQKWYKFTKEESNIMAENAVWGIMESFLVIPYDYYSYQKTKDKRYNYVLPKSNIELIDRDWNELINHYNKYYDSDINKFIRPATFLIDDIDSIKNANDILGKEKLKTDFNKDILMYAVHMNNYEAVKELIDIGYDVNHLTTEKYSDCFGHHEIYNRSVLMYAMENASIEIIKLLFDSGADINAKDIQNRDIYYYLKNNPKFSVNEKKLTIEELISSYEEKDIFFKPSFDISKANTRIEKLIVKSKTLSIYDREMSIAYNKLKRISPYKEFEEKNQKDWLKQRNQINKIDKTEKELKIDLLHFYRARIRYLNQRIETLETPAKDMIKKLRF